MLTTFAPLVTLLTVPSIQLIDEVPPCLIFDLDSFLASDRPDSDD